MRMYLLGKGGKCSAPDYLFSAEISENSSWNHYLFSEEISETGAYRKVLTASLRTRYEVAHGNVRHVHERPSRELLLDRGIEYDQFQLP